MLALILPANICATGFEDILGQWHGQLKEHGIYLKMALNIKKNGQDDYSATLKNFPQNEEAQVTSIFFEDSSIKFKIIELGIEYKGSLEKDGSIKGVFKQNGLLFNVSFSREEKRRPQEPVKPYPYKEEEVSFQSEAEGVTLAGTLTMPYGKGPFAAIVLISGSGPHNRDEEEFGHKPFLVIADYLTKRGFAVLRYDDRGAGASSGDFKSATTADFAVDAKSALKYLEYRNNIDKKKIGIIGHGEGALIAAIAASEQRNTAFIVMLAGIGLPGKDIILEQNEVIGKASKMNKTGFKLQMRMSREAVKILSGQGNYGQTRNALAEYAAKTFDSLAPYQVPKGVGKTDFMRSYINTYAGNWMRYFVNYDPAQTLKWVKCPVLAVSGGKDMHVNARKNLKAINNALKEGGNKDITIGLYSGLNHLFQESKTGFPAEYSYIDQTFFPAALAEIADWIENKTKRENKK